MSEELRISVVIPTIGSPRSIMRTLQTLEDQSMPPDEIILVYDREKRGAPWARNLGASYARGKYILFSDDDIEWEPYALKTMYGFLQSNHRLAFAWGSYKNRETGAHNCTFPFSEKEFYRRNLSSTMALIRRSKFPGFDEKIERLQDWDLWLTMVEAGEKGINCGKVMFTTGSMRGISGNGRAAEARAAIRKKHSKGLWPSK